jgi:uncharacterized RDD family membrane protein YckC
MTDSPNPYSTPQAELELSEADRPRVPAGKGRRFGTFVVDYLMFMVLSFAFGAGVGLLFGDAGIQALEAVPDLLLGLLILSTYYIFFEAIWARTPGKLLLGTVVVSEAGTKPSFGQIVGRTLCRFIPFEAFSCFGERAWHDSLPKTWVVQAKGR